MTNKFKIGLDLDGVMCNNTPFWNVYYEANRLRHQHTVEPTVPYYWNYYKDICRLCFNDVLHTDEVVKNYVPYDGAVEVYKWLANYHKDKEIAFITSRPGDIERTTIEWVNKWFSPSTECCHVIQGKKGLFSKENKFDLVVDDSPEQILDFLKHEIPVIIMDRPYNQGIEGIRVYSIEEMESAIINYFKERKGR